MTSATCADCGGAFMLGNTIFHYEFERGQTTVRIPLCFPCKLEREKHGVLDLEQAGNQSGNVFGGPVPE